MFFAMYFVIKTMDFPQEMWFNITNRVYTGSMKRPTLTIESIAAKNRWNILKEESLNEEAV